MLAEEGRNSQTASTITIQMPNFPKKEFLEKLPSASTHRIDLFISSSMCAHFCAISSKQLISCCLLMYYCNLHHKFSLRGNSNILFTGKKSKKNRGREGGGGMKAVEARGKKRET